MRAITFIRQKTDKLPNWAVSVLIGLASFCVYTSMYAFRKAFAAGTFSNHQFFYIDYKVWLVIAQVCGYTLSKFYGIRFISSVNHTKRGRYIIILITLAWVALLGFAIIPAPYNIVFLFINGFPLGMIWGLVFSYVEGRRSTEFMAAILSISLIFASGFVKTIGRSLIIFYHLNQYWMPFVTGLIFIAPLLIFVCCLEVLPPPNQQDIQARKKRNPMNSADRKKFIANFLPGIVLTLIIYVLLTIMRDVRDNFEVEIWTDLGIKGNTIYTKVDAIISVIVLFMISLLILIRKNINAFIIIHVIIIGGCVLVGTSTLLFNFNLIGAIYWMFCVGLGLYMAYIPYNAIFFERMIACFKFNSNVGFVMYIADSAGYLGSISILLIKELGRPTISWGTFFKECVLLVSIVGAISAFLSLLYFIRKYKKTENLKNILSYEQ